MRYTVKLTADADEQLTALYQRIATEATPVTSERYISAILNHCDALATFPQRAPARDDIRPGMRVTHYRGRTLIPYYVDEGTSTVWVLGIYYGGQNYEADLKEIDQ